MSGGQSVSNCTMGGPICKMQPFLLHFLVDLALLCRIAVSKTYFWPILTNKKTLLDLLVVYQVATKHVCRNVIQVSK